MTAPDLPMRERIAEALWLANNPDIPEWSRQIWAEMAASGDFYLTEARDCLARADALLAVITTPSEAMVERGARALYLSAGGTLNGWEEQPSVIRGEFIDDTRAVLTAALADEKEA